MTGLTGGYHSFSRHWQRKSAVSREYGVIRDGNIFRTSFHHSFLFTSEFEEARALHRSLLEQYRGRCIEDVFRGREIETVCGTCYELEHREVHKLRPPDRDAIRDAVLSDLTLLYGIGPRNELKLRNRGYATVEDLAGHPSYQKDAGEIIRAVDSGDPAALYCVISKWHPASHPLLFGLSSFHDPEDLVFLDIETLGLFSRPIILFGVATVHQGALRVRQYLLRDICEEAAALSAIPSYFAGEHPALVTFNGKAFDRPYIQERCAYYGIPEPYCTAHYDLLHFSRRFWNGHFQNCRLTTLERELFGIRRGDDVPSQMVPEFYESYLSTGNPGPLVPVVDHNRQDVISLALLYSRLTGEIDGSR